MAPAGVCRSRLYPEAEPYISGRLAVAPPHKLYWEESGSPDGSPALFLHGGPGAGLTEAGRRFFDPAHYRIIAFDQRGAGHSTPHGELAGNDTAALIDDIESLRRARGIDRWLVLGGSWGALLALAYAEAHPDRCRALVLRGVFLGGRAEVDWFLYGMRRFFPEAWRVFAGHLPAAERNDLLAGYHRRLVDPDPAIHMPAARAWSQYEGACSALVPRAETLARYDDDRAALGLARIEAHYFANGCFLHEGALLAGARRIADLPGAIVQGRYDMICPPGTAEQLARAWPGARFDIVPDAGHSALERGTAAALVAATERFKMLE